MKYLRAPLAALALAALSACATAQVPPPDLLAQGDYRERLPSDEIVYFVLPDRFENGDRANDRGGLSGDRLQTGYDPAAEGFYHGGDLAGLTERLPYLEQLGITAIWFAPIFTNKPVQGPGGEESAGYHGYWVTDFTSVDPHLGTNEEFRSFVDAAHARGMKVYMDIITNHTADVIRYVEGDEAGYVYRSRADYPSSRKAGVAGPAMNDSNGDGIGDLPGIIDELDYIASLGVNGIWISPFFTSPMLDLGYDVADFCEVDPVFGTLADFDTLIARAHALGLKVIIDQVYLHSSDKHEWFTQSRSSRDNDKADWYVWADPKPGGTPAQQLPIGVFRPGLVMGRAPAAILSPQFPDPATRSQSAQPGRAGCVARRRQVLAGARGRRLQDRCRAALHARSGANR